MWDFLDFFKWFGFKKQKNGSVALQPEASYTVTVDETCICCQRPDGVKEIISWNELEIITLLNTDEGPFVPDVFWLLEGNQITCVIPQGATGEDELLKCFQKLPNFNNDAVIQSSGCTDNKEFICWQKTNK